MVSSAACSDAIETAYEATEYIPPAITRALQVKAANIMSLDCLKFGRVDVQPLVLSDDKPSLFTHIGKPSIVFQFGRACGRQVFFLIESDANTRRRQPTQRERNRGADVPIPKQSCHDALVCPFKCLGFSK